MAQYVVRQSFCSSGVHFPSKKNFHRERRFRFKCLAPNDLEWDQIDGNFVLYTHTFLSQTTERIALIFGIASSLKTGNSKEVCWLINYLDSCGHILFACRIYNL